MSATFEQHVLDDGALKELSLDPDIVHVLVRTPLVDIVCDKFSISALNGQFHRKWHQTRAISLATTLIIKSSSRSFSSSLPLTCTAKFKIGDLALRTFKAESVGGDCEVKFFNLYYLAVV